MARFAWSRQVGEQGGVKRQARRLALEALEDRVPPGDLLGVLQTVASIEPEGEAPEDQPLAQVASAPEKEPVAEIDHLPPPAPAAGTAPQPQATSASSSTPSPTRTGEGASDLFPLLAAASVASAQPAASSPPSGQAASSSAGASDSAASPAAAKAGTQSMASIAAVSGNGVDGSQPDPKAGLLGSQHLRDLYDSVTNPDGPQKINPFLQRDDQGRVLVQVRSNGSVSLGAFRDSLTNAGMEEINATASSRMVTGWLPVASLNQLSSIAGYSAAVPVFRPTLRTGAANSEGDAVIAADSFRASYAVSGAGVTVGVLSDSVGRVGGGLSDSVASGDLPAGVGVLADGPAGSTDEGRAMLEIVHDVAPGAGLAFHTASGGPAGFADGIRALYDAGARVITDDVGYVNSPLFSVGRVGQAVAEVSANGALYLTAAGNDGDNGWRADWQPIFATVGDVTGTFQSFDGSALQTFSLAEGETVDVGFRWSEAYLEGGDPAPNFQVDADYAVYVVDAATGAILATQDDDNGNTDQAFELLSFSNDGSFGTTQFAFAFRLVSGPAPAKLGWVQHGGPEIDALGAGGPTLYGQALSPSAVTVGATSAADPTGARSYSSRGGAMELFSDEQGRPLGAPLVVNKPDLAAPDGVSTSFHGQLTDASYRFSGTSAAVSHVAGAAALLREQVAGATPTEVARHLRETAADLGEIGPDAETGAGLVQLTSLAPPPAPPEPPAPEPPAPPAPPPPADDGPMLGADGLENNDSSDSATALGVLNGPVALGGLTIAPGAYGLQDRDWFSVVAGATGAFTVDLRGEEGGKTLEAQLYVAQGGFLTPIAMAAFTPQQPASLTCVAALGSTLYVEVRGASSGLGSAQRGAYGLAMRIV